MPAGSLHALWLENGNADHLAIPSPNQSESYSLHGQGHCLHGPCVVVICQRHKHINPGCCLCTASSGHLSLYVAESDIGVNLMFSWYLTICARVMTYLSCYGALKIVGVLLLLLLLMC